jgi:hypothetical protein
MSINSSIYPFRDKALLLRTPRSKARKA